MNIKTVSIPQMIDISLLRWDVTPQEVERMIAAAMENSFICSFTMPCYTQMLVDAFRKDANFKVGAPVGFPTGTDTTQAKRQQAEQFIQMGVDEIDMVINVGWLKAGLHDKIAEELALIRKVCSNKVLKVILEVTLLNDNQIRNGCKLVIESGGDYVKSGTGFQPTPTTLHHIRVMKESVGDRIKIKAAGGVRDIETLLVMYKMGVTRFGLSLDSSLLIMQQIKELPDEIEI